MKKVIFSLFLVLAVLVLIVLLMPAPISPVAYSPPSPPIMSGVLAKNQHLRQAELLGLGQVNGPEEVAVDSQGRVYAGVQDGKIMRLTPEGQITLFADTLGRPLGMQFDNHQNLIVCDAYQGLLSINPQGQITVLASAYNGVPFKFTDALDIAQDGMIYFTDASAKYQQTAYLYDLLESKPHGRLLSYNPVNGELTQLLSDLYFANGVALSQQEDFVLVNETYRYRIIRYWLKGAKAGTRDVFIDNLPGFPDNISSNGNGKFWLALFTVRNSLMDSLHPYPFLKKQLSKLPKMFWPKPQPYGIVLALNEQGEITQSLQDPSGKHLKEITSAHEINGFLYLGSLHNDRIGKYALPPP